jgi:hypothetical protein
MPKKRGKINIDNIAVIMSQRRPGGIFSGLFFDMKKEEGFLWKIFSL